MDIKKTKARGFGKRLIDDPVAMDRPTPLIPAHKIAAGYQQILNQISERRKQRAQAPKPGGPASDRGSDGHRHWGGEVAPRQEAPPRWSDDPRPRQAAPPRMSDDPPSPKRLKAMKKSTAKAAIGKAVGQRSEQTLRSEVRKEKTNPLRTSFSGSAARKEGFGLKNARTSKTFDRARAKPKTVGATMRGKRGGSYVVTKSGLKIYVKR